MPKEEAEPPEREEEPGMARAATLVTWSFVALAVVLMSTVALGDGIDPAVTIAVVVLAGAVGIGSGRAVNQVRTPYLVIVAIAGLYAAGRVAFPSITAGDVTSMVSGLIELVTNVVLVFGMYLVLRARRGPFDSRDALDAATMFVGGLLVAWLLVVTPVVDSGVMGSAPSTVAAAYLPFSLTLLGLTAAVLMTGLSANIAMRLVTAAVAVNTISDVLRGLDKAGAIGDVSEFTTMWTAGSFVLLAAAAAHPSVRELFRHTGDADQGRQNLRLTIVLAAVLAPVVLVAATDSSTTTDRAVRIAGLALLVLFGSVRLIQAIRASESARASLQDRLERDELTGLPNRVALLSTLDELLEETWRAEQRPMVLMVTIDRYKHIHDTYGQDLAGIVISDLAQRLSAAASQFGATVTRPAPDEFVIIDPAVVSPSQAVLRAETVKEAYDQPVTVGDTTVFVTASIGAVVAPRNRTISSEELLRRADIATDRAKENGRNCVALFDDSMQSDLARRMALEGALHGAVERREMRLYHQAIVEIGTGEITGFEALIRWRREDGTVVPPSDFIPIAEETGTINALGSWVMLEALSELRRWIDDGTVAKTTTMSVNVSPRQVADPHFPDIVNEALQRSGVPADLLWLEVTESMMLSEPEHARATLRKICNMGVRVALDDFGTGYSSLSLLQRFPLQRIKIDRAFVGGVADTEHDRSLVRTIIAMGHSLNLDIVAEGVETIHQLSALRDLGCAKAQGYLISHPVPADAIRSTMVALRDLGALSIFHSDEATSSSRF
jgi:diguanylate cyclase